jgi:hypothetical protein
MPPSSRVADAYEIPGLQADHLGFRRKASRCIISFKSMGSFPMWIEDRGCRDETVSPRLSLLQAPGPSKQLAHSQ